MAFPKKIIKKENFPHWMKEIFFTKKKEYRCGLKFLKRIKDNTI